MSRLGIEMTVAEFEAHMKRMATEDQGPFSGVGRGKSLIVSRIDDERLGVRVRNANGGLSGESNPNWRGGPESHVCERCKTEYTKWPKHGKGRFCSLTCANAWQRETSPGAGEQRKERVAVQCRECGTAFLVLPSRATGRRVFCSVKCNGAWRVRNLTHGVKRSKGGARDDLGGKYFRSAWEANYARVLNWRVEVKDIAKWEYEVETFAFAGIKRGARTYTPDFKITRNSGTVYFVEIKGYLTPQGATRLKRMRKYHPHVELQMVRQEEYRALAKSFSWLPGWESEKGKTA